MSKIYSFILLLIISTGPVFGSDESTLWEDDRFKLCLSETPDEADLVVLSDGVYSSPEDKYLSAFKAMWINDSKTDSTFAAIGLGNVCYLIKHAGQDVSFLQQVAPYLKSQGYCRLLVDICSASPYYARFLQLGFSQLKNQVDHPSLPQTCLVYDIAKQEGTLPDHLTCTFVTMSADTEGAEDEEATGSDEEGVVLNRFDLKMKTLSRFVIFLRDKTNDDLLLGGAYVKIKEQDAAKPLAVLKLLWLKNDPNVRGHGFAKRILSFLEQHATRLGCGRVELESEEFLSWGFYPKQGYKVIAQLADYYLFGDRSYKSYVLEKKL